MYLGCDSSGRFHKRFRDMEPKQFLTALQHEAEIDLVFDKLYQRRPSELEYNTILPALSAATKTSNSGEFEQVRDKLAYDISANHVVDQVEDLAQELLWNCTIVLRTFQLQPQFTWSSFLWKDALARWQKLLKIDFRNEVPHGASRRQSSLLASLASPAPAGGNIILFHAGLSGMYGICQDTCVLFNMVNNLQEKGVPREVISIIETAQFAKLARHYLEYEIAPEYKELFESLPVDEAEISDKHSDIVYASTHICLAFTILHECGHIELGHTEQIRNRDAFPSQQEMHQFEFEADTFALSLLESSSSNGDLPVVSICELLSYYARTRILSGEPRSTPTHPSFEDRISNLLRVSNEINSNIRGNFLAMVDDLKSMQLSPPLPLFKRM
jgi:hypothetical protein